MYANNISTLINNIVDEIKYLQYLKNLCEKKNYVQNKST